MAYIGNDVRSNEDYKIIDDISSGFNGSTTSFALQVGGATPVPFPKFEQQLLISVNGVIQEPDPTGSAGFKLLGTNIVFSSAPTNGHAFFGVIYAGADYVNAGGTFPDGSINFPSITFSEDTNTGFTRTASGTISVISDGTKVAQFPTSQGSNGQVLVTDGGGTLSYSSIITSPIVSGDLTIPDKIVHAGDTDTAIRFPAADTFSVETAGTEKLRVDSGGHISIGTATSRAIGGSVERKLQIEATSADAGVAITRNSANAVGPFLSFGKSRSSSVGGTTVVQSGDQLGQINFSGADGSDIVSNAASIAAFVDGTPGSNDMPGRLIFSTTADGAASVTERMRIDSSGNVGIGDTNPDSGKLHISSSTGTIGYFESTQAATNPANIVGNSTQTNSSSNLILQVNGGTTAQGIVRLNVDNSIAIHNGATPTEKLRIDSSGNVGIGVTSIQERLHVANAGNCNITSQCTASGSGANAAVQVKSADGGDYLIQTGNAVSGGLRVYDAGASAERVRIDSAGRVGIGATSPGHLLEIKSSAQNANDVLTQIESVAVSSGESKTSLELHKGTGYGAQLSGYISQGVGSGFILSTLNGGTATERMRIDSSGNVGIGTASPESKLSVDGSVAISSNATAVSPSGYDLKIRSDTSKLGIHTDNASGTPILEFGTGGATGGFIYTSQAQPLRFGINASEKARIDSSGNVGIGLTSSPVSSNSEQGVFLAGADTTQSVIASNSTPLVINRVGTGGNDRNCLELRNNGTLRGNIGAIGAANGMYFETGTSEAMRIDSSGRVGIGTSSPSTPLHVSTNTDGTSDLLTLHADADGQNANNGIASIKFMGNSNHAAFIKGGHTANGDTILTFHTDAHDSGINPEERMRIDSSGNVGIGGTAPNYQLHATTNIAVGAHGFAQQLLLGNNSIQSQLLGTGYTNMSINASGGNVGIGTTAPSELLTINGADKSALIRTSNGIGTAKLKFEADGTNYAGIGLENTALVFRCSNNSSPTERMRILDNGRIGINITTSDAKVTVSENANLLQPLIIRDANNTNSVTHYIGFRKHDSEKGSIKGDRGGTSFNTTSDYRLKQNVTSISDGITRIKQLLPKKFSFIEDETNTLRDGFLAHEVSSLVPEAVDGTKDAVDSDNKPIYQGIDHSKLVPLLTAALKEAVTKIETLETKVAALEAA